MTPLFAALAGALLVAGVLGLIVGGRRRPVMQSASSAPSWLVRLRRYPKSRLWLTVGGVAAGVVVALLTGWVIALAVVPAAVIGLPRIMFSTEERRRIEKLNALGEWVRTLSSLMMVSGGLEGSIMASVRSVQPPVHSEVSALAARLRARWNTEAALRQFAEDLNLPTGDLVAATLILASRRRAGGLVPVLQGLSESVAADVAAQREIEADRAKPRNTARMVTGLTLGIFVVIGIVSGDYMRPYGTVLGQVLLSVLLAGYVAVLLWMHKMAQAQPPRRFLSVQDRP